MGNFLVVGFQQTGYLPVRLALASLVWAIFGSVMDDILIESWLDMLQPSDRRVIEDALQSVNSDKRDLVIDILDTFGISSMPTTANIRTLCICVSTLQTWPWYTMLHFHSCRWPSTD
ncbi:hypothetical protein DPMN_182629 [Dreissena polymorpha]|uniref:Uncharacterized protein n=1 Tax=Dreissena polymorpha TaxID=45954 RepID=A0A9D4DFS5_DREPO|nr:hypothetical protein DPMN_182629 [Dreissena polymorpha]